MFTFITILIKFQKVYISRFLFPRSLTLTAINLSNKNSYSNFKKYIYDDVIRESIKAKLE